MIYVNLIIIYQNQVPIHHRTVENKKDKTKAMDDRPENKNTIIHRVWIVKNLFRMIM